MKSVSIGSLLLRQKNIIIIEDEEKYKRVTIRTKNQGVTLRNIEKGIEIGTKNQFVINKGQFLLSKIDARYGAFGIVPNELDDAIITGNFWAYEVDNTQLNIEWFHIYTSSPHFIKICDQASSGTTNRRYLNENKFLSHEILLPDIGEQLYLIEKYKSSKEKYSNLGGEIEKQALLLSSLRQSILQEAIQGKLVPQDPYDEPARVLLEKIKAEKEQLIKEKKIKKEKQLPPILDDEIPYDLPQGWEWVRLRSIISKIGAGSTPSGGKNVYSDSGIKFIRSQNVWNDGLKLDNVSFISDEINSKMQGSLVKSNDILLNITGASIGRSCVTSNEFDIGNVNQHVSIIRLIYLGMNSFIHKCIISPYVQDLIMDVQVGVSREGLSMEKLGKFLIPIPPLNEQKRIVEKVDQLIALCDELEKTVEQSKQESEMLMQAVLQEAFSNSEKANNIVHFPISEIDDYEEEWDIAARAEDGIAPETLAKIEAVLNEVSKRKK